MAEQDWRERAVEAAAIWSAGGPASWTRTAEHEGVGGVSRAHYRETASAFLGAIESDLGPLAPAETVGDRIVKRLYDEAEKCPNEQIAHRLALNYAADWIRDSLPLDSLLEAERPSEGPGRTTHKGPASRSPSSAADSERTA